MGTKDGLENDEGLFEQELSTATARFSTSSSDAGSNNHILIQRQNITTADPRPIVKTDPTAVPDTKGLPSDPGVINGHFWEQWHHTGTYGMNTIPVWNEYTGEGISVAVFDDGVNYNHSELSTNYRTDLDYDTLGNDNNAINQGADSHGTYVSQVIGADDNGARGVGVAFDTDLIGIRRGFNGAGTTADTLEGFQHALSVDADVMNNSWGTGAAFGDNIKINFAGTDTSEVTDYFETMVNTGRGGLGTNIVFSAGNDREDGISANYKNYQNSPYTITVGALSEDGDYASFSAAGSNLLVTAPGEGIVLSSASDTASGAVLNGTSFSAPAVSGVIALMLEANDDLGYRDVQEILAMTSRQVDAGGTGWAGEGWQTNGATNWNGGGMHFSHDYGYGNVDALAAVRLAETWGQQQTYANMTKLAPVTSAPSIAIPATGTITNTINIGSDIEIEHVIIDLDISHARAGDLIVTLTSPDGTDSTLMYRVDNGSFTTAYGVYQGVNFEFSSVAHWGESSAGTWTLTIQDVAGGNAGTLNDWSLSFLGSHHSADDVYVYTDEYAGMTGARRTLTDSDGGIDTINASAVSIGDTTINLTTGTGAIAGNAFNLGVGTVIEHVYTGDGNDSLTGNSSDNTLFGGRGDDSIYGSAGNDTLDGDQGTDTAFYNVNISNFLITLVDAATVTLQSLVGGLGTDTLLNFENFNFNGTNYTRAELDDYVADGGGQSVMSTRLTLGWSGGGYNLNNNDAGTFTYTGEDLGKAGVTQNLLNVTRGAASVNAQVITPSSGEIDTALIRNDNITDVTLSGFRSLEVDQDGSTNNTSVTLTQTMRGRVTTGSGNDSVNITLQEIVAANPADVDQWFITTNSGADNIVIGGAISNMFGTIDLGTGNDELDINVQGNDTVYARNGDDTVNSGNGFDRVWGGLGNDTINGEAGDDQLYGDEGNDIINGGDGFDKIEGGSGNDQLNGGGNADTILGDAGEDIISGGTHNDVLRGGNDNDTLNGDDGNDQLFGDDGDDRVNGGNHNDFIRGGDGVDTLHGDAGNDKLYGDNGDDIIYGDAGFDALYGGNNNDTMFGGADNDRLYGQNGNDRLDGGIGSDILSAGSGTDVMIGGDGADRIYGGAGQDTFALTVFDASAEHFYGFSVGFDRINVTDILTGYTDGVDDIADFVQLLDLGGGTTDLRIDADGSGGYARAALIYSDFGGQSAQDLLDNGTLIADVSA